MSATEPLTVGHPPPYPLQRVEMPKWPHVVLVTGSVALLIIGILATLGILNGMGITNAAYLSYGMYGGAALFALAEVGMLISSHCPKKEKHQIVDLELEARLDPGLMLETILTSIGRPRLSYSHPLPSNTLPTPYTLLCTTLMRPDITELKSQVSRQINSLLETEELQAALAQIEMMRCSPPVISIALADCPSKIQGHILNGLMAINLEARLKMAIYHELKWKFANADTEYPLSSLVVSKLQAKYPKLYGITPESHSTYQPTVSKQIFPPKKPEHSSTDQAISTRLFHSLVNDHVKQCLANPQAHIEKLKEDPNDHLSLAIAEVLTSAVQAMHASTLSI